MSALQAILRNSILPLSAIAASTYYTSRLIAEQNENFEARMDEIEGTLRGHVGLIEDSLERIEGRKIGQNAPKKDEKK